MGFLHPTLLFVVAIRTVGCVLPLHTENFHCASTNPDFSSVFELKTIEYASLLLRKWRVLLEIFDLMFYPTLPSGRLFRGFHAFCRLLASVCCCRLVARSARVVRPLCTRHCCRRFVGGRVERLLPHVRADGFGFCVAGNLFKPLAFGFFVEGKRGGGGGGGGDTDIRERERERERVVLGWWLNVPAKHASVFQGRICSDKLYALPH